MAATNGAALLTHEHRRQCRGDDPAHAGVTAARDEQPVGRERAPGLRQRVARDVVHDHVVARPALREVLPRVVDDVIRADGADHLDVPRAADAGHLGAERLGDLHGERPDAPRRAVDEHLLPRPDLAVVAKSLKRGAGGRGYGRGLLERQVARLVRDRRPRWRPRTRRTSRGTRRTPRHRAGSGSRPLPTDSTTPAKSSPTTKSFLGLGNPM